MQVSSKAIVFCASARSGLGHLRRVANIARAIEDVHPGIPKRLVINAPVAGLATHELQLFASLDVVERTAMARHLAASDDIGAVVVDTAIVPDIELLGLPLALVMRKLDTERISAFRLSGGRCWDEVLIAEPQSEFMVEPDAIGARNVTNIGWIYRSPPAVEVPLRSDYATILIASGGGGDRASIEMAREVERVVDELRRISPRPVHVTQAIGPRAAPGSRIATADAWIDPGSDLNAWFARADLVMTTSGYNSILELAALDVPALLFAIPRTYDDQSARACAWADTLGLAHVTGDFPRSARWMAECLARDVRRCPANLPPSGCDAAAHRLARLVEQSQPADSQFAKPAKQNAPPDVAARRSRLLFSRGVPCIPAARINNAGDLEFARIDGPTGLEAWISAGEVRNDLVQQLMLPVVRLHDVSSAGLDVRRHDLWPLIRGRLAALRILAPPPALARASTRLDALATKLTASVCAPPQHRLRLIHGDLHLRQLIRPAERSEFLLVDFDDLAVGLPETDIGNCIANLVTNERLPRVDVSSAARGLMREFADAYRLAGGEAIEPAMLRPHVAIALLRRLLKLHERGIADDFAAEIHDATEELAGVASLQARRSATAIAAPGSREGLAP